MKPCRVCNLCLRYLFAHAESFNKPNPDLTVFQMVMDYLAERFFAALRATPKISVDRLLHRFHSAAVAGIINPAMIISLRKQ